MRNKYLKIIQTLLFILIILSLSDFFLKQFTFFTKAIDYPYVIEYRDAATVDITKLISNSKNPFTFRYVLPHTYIYGLAFPSLTAGLSILFHTIDLYTLQKIVSFLFILLTVFLTGYEIHKRSKNIFLVILGSAVPFSLMFADARTESMGIFFYILVLIMAQYQLDRFYNIIFIAFLATFLFFIKQYFVIAGIILLIFYSFKSKKSLFTFLTSAFIIFIIEFYFINSKFPLYFPNIIVNQLNAAAHNVPHMLLQTKVFFIQYYPVSLLFLTAIITNIRKLKKIKIDYRNINKPLFVLKNTYFTDIFVIATIVSFTLLTLILGQNPGTFMTYYLQLLPITLSISTFTYLGNNLNRIRFKEIILPITIIIIIIASINNNHVTFTAKSLPGLLDMRGWNEAITMIKKYQPSKTYLSPPLSIVALKLNWPIYDNGQTDVYIYTKGNHKLLNYIMPSLINMENYHKQWENNLDNKIIHKEFSLIVVTKNLHPDVKISLLNKYYNLKQTLSFDIGLPYGNQTEFWVPVR
jgi:hypothetical protein